MFGSAGVDVEWGIMSNMTLNTTFNPDFGQVEVDPVGGEPDKEFGKLIQGGGGRAFFLEESRIFQTPAENMTFYTRRIGRTPQGFVDGTFVDVPEHHDDSQGAAKLTRKNSQQLADPSASWTQ